MDSSGKGEADKHPAGIGLDGLIDKFADLGEGLDIGETPIHLFPAESHQGPVHIDIIATSKFGIKSRAEFQHRGDTAVDENASARWLEYTADDLEQRALSTPVLPDDPDRLSLF